MYRVKNKYTKEFIEYWVLEGRTMGGTQWFELEAYETETEAIQWCCRYQDS